MDTITFVLMVWWIITMIGLGGFAGFWYSRLRNRFKTREFHLPKNIQDANESLLNGGSSDKKEERTYIIQSDDSESDHVIYTNKKKPKRTKRVAAF